MHSLQKMRNSISSLQIHIVDGQNLQFESSTTCTVSAVLHCILQKYIEWQATDKSNFFSSDTRDQNDTKSGPKMLNYDA